MLKKGAIVVFLLFLSLALCLFSLSIQLTNFGRRAEHIIWIHPTGKQHFNKINLAKSFFFVHPIRTIHVSYVSQTQIQSVSQSEMSLIPWASFLQYTNNTHVTKQRIGTRTHTPHRTTLDRPRDNDFFSFLSLSLSVFCLALALVLALALAWEHYVQCTICIFLLYSIVILHFVLCHIIFTMSNCMQAVDIAQCTHIACI